MAIETGCDEDVRRAMQEWGNLSDAPEDADQLQAYIDFGKWQWRPNHTSGPFDFSDLEYVRDGIEIFSQIARRRYSRGHESSFLQLRWTIGYTMMLYRLGANVDAPSIGEEEVPAAGWNRAD